MADLNQLITAAVTFSIVTTNTRCNLLSTITPTVFTFPEMFLFYSGFNNYLLVTEAARKKSTFYVKGSRSAHIPS